MYSTQDLFSIWLKGQIAQGYDPTTVRKDACGALMVWKEYGNRNSPYGWEVDHINPAGSNSLSNLRPLQWENNLDKSDGILKCNIQAIGPSNRRVK